MNLNVGCGLDEWGDIRLDIDKFRYRHKVKLNIRGDAQNLPFRDKVFQKTLASHLLEHLPNWKKAIQEWCRVTAKEIEIIIPVDAGLVKTQVCSEILSLTLSSLRDFLYLKARRREHLWNFNPKAIVYELEKNGFKAKTRAIKTPLIRFLSYGRKSRFLPFRILSERLRIDSCHEIVGERL